MPIIVVEVIGIEELAELAIAMPDIVLDAAIDMAVAGIVLVEDIDIAIEPSDPAVDMSIALCVAKRMRKTNWRGEERTTNDIPEKRNQCHL